MTTLLEKTAPLAAALADSIDHMQISRRNLPGDGGRVVVKKALDNQAIRQLAHEAAMLARLASVEGVAKVSSAVAELNTLILQDEGAVTLAEFLRTKRLSPLQATAYAHALAGILADVHKAGVIHKDISPSNLLIHPETLRPTLIDFNIASHVDDAQPAAEAQAGISGTLAYMSPEQTGRTGRTPDQRSDLYSLGITLYEMLVHRKPFESEDILALVHDHLVHVPEAPVQLNAQVPQLLSDVVMRLLQKEPDLRYQSADGLAQDLHLIHKGLQNGDLTSFVLGQFDFGVRLKPPTRLIGREAEVAVLHQAAGQLAKSRSQCLLISGESGVGKTALLPELRSLAAVQKAWYVMSTFTPEAGESDAALDAFQTLGRLLLALPAEQIAHYRACLLTGLGDKLGSGPSLLPDFIKLLGAHPALEVANAQEAEALSVQACVAMLRSVVTPERPMLLVLDNLHHAPGLTLAMLDALLRSPEPIPGLLIVGTFDNAVAGADGLFAALKAQWSTLATAPQELSIKPLSAAAAGEFVAESLRMPTADAQDLANVLSERTQNIPQRTLELLNALRDDGLLKQSNRIWAWNAEALRRYVGYSSPAELRDRIDALPAETSDLLRSLACLGVEAHIDVLALAVGMRVDAVRKCVALAVDEGLLATLPDDELVIRFSKDRVRQAALTGLTPEARSFRHLTLARGLAAQAAEQPALAGLAAEQYLPAADILDDETERRHVVDFFEDAAQRLRLSDPKHAERYLAAAIRVLQTVAGPDDRERLFALKVEHHRGLFEQGRLDEGDVLYAEIAALASSPENLLEPTRIQTYGLMNRRRMPEAMTLGLSLMSQFGLSKPDDVPSALGEGIKRLTLWHRGDEKLNDFERPETADARVVALTKIIPETSNPAYFVDIAIWAWLGTEALRLWTEYGPSPRILASIGSMQSLLVGAPQDFQGAYKIGRHVLAVGEARGYEPSTSFSRCLFGIYGAHWVEPIDTVVETAFRRARADLIALGDESFVSYTYIACDLLLDCAPTLDEAAAEVEEGLAFAARSNNKDFESRYKPRRQLIKSLCGQATAAGSFSNDDFDEDGYVQSIDPTSPTAAAYHTSRSISAAIFGDIASLAVHAAKALPLGVRTPGYYVLVIVRVFQVLALSEKARALPSEERAAVIEEIDATCLKWLAARAADAPENFLHLLRWAEAERAWAADSVWAAGAAFDVAVQESTLHTRPWHRAIIHERAALFHLAQGMEHTARPLLTHACDTYEAWGAAGKVKEMRRQHAFLRASRGLRKDAGSRTLIVDTEMVDMMAVLRASQALSSETSLERLTAQVSNVLGAITGATGVQVIARAEEGSDSWVMASSLGASNTPVTVDQAGAAGDIPLTVFRYVERTCQVLVLDDIVRDDRFSTDPYAARFDQCSLVLAPIMKQGQLNAMLVLENSQRRGAFSAERLDAVSMIAGQLSVSLDNALLYASLEKRVAERTAQLKQKTNDINAMLQNMPQGVLTITAGGLIHPEYSAYLETIFETREVAHQNVMALVFANTSLGADALSQIHAAIDSCIGEDQMNYAFNAHLLATDFDKTLPDGGVKSLALSWSSICDDDGTVDKLMLCVRDVTELKRLEKEANTRKRELQIISEILAVAQEKFHPFIAGARAFLKENKLLLEQPANRNDDAVDVLFRNMHTIKGNARTYGLLSLTNLVHVAEQRYDDLRKNDALEWNQPTLLAELAGVHELLETYSHINDTVLGRGGPGRRGEPEKFLLVECEKVHQSLQLLQKLDQADAATIRTGLQQVKRMLNLLGTETLAEIIAGSLDSLPSLANELGKAMPLVVIEEHGILIRNQAGGLLKDLFMHLLRNAMDHGIEAAELRREKGKPTAGVITISLAVNDGKLWIRMHDDGRGLAIATIRQRAIDKSLVLPGQEPCPHEVAQFIFHSGLSTAEQVTEISGRGVGMNAVKGYLQAEGGDAYINLLDSNTSSDFRPFEIVISLPEKFAVQTTT